MFVYLQHYKNFISKFNKYNTINQPFVKIVGLNITVWRSSQSRLAHNQKNGSANLPTVTITAA